MFRGFGILPVIANEANELSEVWPSPTVGRSPRPILVQVANLNQLVCLHSLGAPPSCMVTKLRTLYVDRAACPIVL